jgi:ketosteroid isomerase-like protein
MDVDAMLAFYATDAVVVDHRRVGIGSFAGHAELRPYYESIFHSAAEMHEDLTVVDRRDHRVAAHCVLTGRLAADPGGPVVTVEYGIVVDVADGLIRRLDIGEDGEHARELLAEL